MKVLESRAETTQDPARLGGWGGKWGKQVY